MLKVDQKASIPISGGGGKHLEMWFHKSDWRKVCTATKSPHHPPPKACAADPIPPVRAAPTSWRIPKLSLVVSLLSKEINSLSWWTAFHHTSASTWVGAARSNFSHSAGLAKLGPRGAPPYRVHLDLPSLHSNFKKKKVTLMFLEKSCTPKPVSGLCSKIASVYFLVTSSIQATLPHKKPNPASTVLCISQK